MNTCVLFLQCRCIVFCSINNLQTNVTENHWCELCLIYRLCQTPRMSPRSRPFPDSINLLGQRWHFVGSFVGPMSTNDFSPMSFCSSGQLNCQPLVRCLSNARSPTSLAYAKVMPTILFQVSRPTLARHDFWTPSIISLEIFDFPYTWYYWLQQFIP